MCVPKPEYVETPTNAGVAVRYTAEHRRQPSHGSYPSSLTDLEFAVLEPLLARAERRGRPSTHSERAMIDSVFYIVRTGCQWRALPKDFPPWAAVWSRFRRWRDSGKLVRMYDALHALWRAQADRKPEPTAAIIDSQSVKTSEKGAPQGTMVERRSKVERGTS